METTTSAPAPRRRPWDRLARVLALLLLVVILTAIYALPLSLIESPFAAPLVLAVITLGLVNVASRLHRLRQRVDEVEARLPPPPPGDQK